MPTPLELPSYLEQEPAVAQRFGRIYKRPRVLEVRHSAVDCAGRDVEPLAQQRRGGQAPPQDELDDLDQAVSEAHGISLFP